jgi:Thoeris protein ThsB, TIR-like domain
MGRRIFISFAHEDKQQAQGFALLQWNPNVNFEFVGRHLISPVESTDETYIRSKVREKMDGTSVTVVLIGPHTAESEWVDFEIRESLERGNAVIGIRLKGAEGAAVPQALKDEGCRVINWEPEKFSDEIERAALIARRPVLGVAPHGGGGGGAGGASRCGR